MTCLVVALLTQAQSSEHEVQAGEAMPKAPPPRHTLDQRETRRCWVWTPARVTLRGGDSREGAMSGTADESEMTCRQLQAMAEPKRLELAFWGLAAQHQQQVNEASSAGRTQDFMQLAREYATGVRMDDQQGPGQERKAAPDFGRAAEAYRAAAESGSALAMYNLGILCIEGRGVPRDAVGGAALLSAAAEKNVSAAQYVLGTLHFKGEGVVRDQRKAFLLFSQAAAAGHLDANEALAECYFRGIGIPKNIKMALHFFGEYDRLIAAAAATSTFETIPIATCGDSEGAGAEHAASQGRKSEIAASRERERARARANMRVCEKQESRLAKTVIVAEEQDGGGGGGGGDLGVCSDSSRGVGSGGDELHVQEDAFGFTSSADPVEDAEREGGSDVTHTHMRQQVASPDEPGVQQVDCARLLHEMQQAG